MSDGAGPGPLLGEVLAALRSGAEAGARVLWNALEPRARAPWGNEAGARRALENAVWSPLVGHVAATLEPWDRRGAAARTTLAVEGRDGAGARFVVSARLASDGAWRLTALRRDDLPWE